MDPSHHKAPAPAMNSGFDFPKPHASPYAPSYAPRPVQTTMPGFAKAMFIADLIFSSLRLLMLPFALLGYVAMWRANDPLLATALWDVLGAFFIAWFGIPANILLLLNKRLAIWLGWAACLATLCHVAVVVWEVWLRASAFAPQPPERTAAHAVGVLLGVTIRLGLAGAYAAALVQFASWCDDSRTSF